MDCKKCGGDSKVVDSRRYNGTRYRKRVCKQCGYSYYTVENEAEALEVYEMIAYRNKYQGKNQNF